MGNYIELGKSENMNYYYEQENRRETRTKVGLLQVTIVLSVLSQIDEIQKYLRPVMFLMWIVIVFKNFVIYKQIRLSNFTILYVFCFLLYTVFCMFTTIVGYDHLDSNYLRLMFLPFLMLIVSSFIKSGEYSIRDIAIPFVFSAVVLAIYTNVKYFSSYQGWLKTIQYTFGQKNSAAQIWTMAIFLCYFLLSKNANNKRKILLYYCIALYLLLMCFLSECRTALIGIGVATLLNIVFMSKHKILPLLGVIIAILIVFRIPAAYTFVGKALGLSKLEQGVDAFSSGRISLYKKALEVFYESPLIGSGSYYVDCSYISILAESGIIGFLLIEIVWFSQIARCLIFVFKNKNILGCFVLSVIVFYVVESFGEANPPFGPGVAAFMFWLMTELIINKKFNENMLN